MDGPGLGPPETDFSRPPGPRPRPTFTRSGGREVKIMIPGRSRVGRVFQPQKVGRAGRPIWPEIVAWQRALNYHIEPLSCYNHHLCTQLAVTLHLFNDVAWEYTLNRSMNFFHATIIVFDYKSLLSSKFIVIWCFVTFICLCKYVIIWYWCNLISCLNFPFEVISHATKTVSGYIAGSGQSDVATCTIKYDERLILPFLPSAMHKWLCISARFFSAYFILARFLERFLDSRRTLPLSIIYF